MAQVWLYEHFGANATNIKFTTLYPGTMYTDLIRKSIPGEPTAASIIIGEINSSI